IEVLKENLDSYIFKYMSDNNIFNDEIEALSELFLGKAKGKTFVISPYPRKSIFSDANDILSFSYNFYSDEINTLVSIHLHINDIKAKKFDLGSFRTGFEEKFDQAVIFLPYKNTNFIARLSDRNEGTAHSFEWNIIIKLMDYVEDGGTIVSFLSTGILNKMSDANSRSYMIDKKYINTIIELPHLQAMPINLSLIVFKKNSENIKLINATKFAQNLRRGVNLDSEKIIRAYNGQIDGALIEIDDEKASSDDFDLTAHHYFDETSNDFINPTPISELTTSVFRGYQIPSELLDEYASKEETKIKLLTLSSIEDGMIVREEIQSLKGIDKKMEHYIIESGDLVISCKGKTFKTAVIEVPYGETYISTGSLIIIRCNKDLIDPMYLKIFLDSELGKAALKRIQTGTTVLSLNPSKLLGILVPLPHLSKQLIVSSSYRYKKKNLKEVRDVCQEMEEEIDKKFNKNFLSQIN
ncbi:MAG: N-6 DNA methylase, partial [Gammaproteobacteria bacterium]|nr:N-6 DNA methylase [Gammaproteobacteria bacterium]